MSTEKTVMRGLLTLMLALPLAAQAALAIQHWQTPQGARVYFVESRELPPAARATRPASPAWRA